MTVYIGVDLGGTKIAAAALDPATGELAGALVVPTEAHEGPQAVIARVARVVGRVREGLGLARGDVAGVGVGVPGYINPATGTTLLLPNLPGAWRGLPAGDMLREQTGMPTALINDARAFVLAEAAQGAGRGAHAVVGLTLGTGIGGGIAIDGRLLLGISGSAGEAGHMTIDPDGPPCNCGSNGCLEQFASGPAISALGVKAVLHGATTCLSEIVAGDLNAITPETIREAAERGDAVAQEILRRSGSYLGVGVANLVTTLSPNRVILGGSVARLGRWLFEPVEAMVRQRVRAVPVDEVAIVPAALGGDAGVIGAAIWAAQQRTELLSQ
jgi:glucokinase